MVRVEFLCLEVLFINITVYCSNNSVFKLISIISDLISFKVEFLLKDKILYYANMIISKFQIFDRMFLFIIIDLINIQKQIVQSSINKNKEYFSFEKNMNVCGSIFYSITDFENFFSNIDQSKLDGFHSPIYQKMRKNIDSITYEEAKSIFIRLNQKNNYKDKKNWKQEEVILFIYVVDKACVKFEVNFQKFTDQIWNNIAELIPGRTGDACKAKMISLVPANLNDTPWTEIQQEMLAEIIETQGSNKWKTVSLKLYERNPTRIYRSSKQCRQRYMCFLKPNLKKGFWNQSQDYQLIMLFLKYGRKWSKMTQFIQGRNQNAIKNRFFLLFEQSSRNQKLYYSQFMRKVMRRKQKLQRILGIKQKYQQMTKEQNIKKNFDKFLDLGQQMSQNIIKIKSESCETERDFKNQEIAEIQKFFAF